jgi:hypothetical protein
MLCLSDVQAINVFSNVLKTPRNALRTDFNLLWKRAGLHQFVGVRAAVADTENRKIIERQKFFRHCVTYCGDLI